MDSSTAMKFRPRDDVLEQLSRSHLADAVQASSADACAANAAFQAGYFALMASLSPDEVGSFDDHPNTEAAALGAQRLQLSSDDVDAAREGAADYYSPAARADRRVQRLLEWAGRVRAAAGWTK